MDEPVVVVVEDDAAIAGLLDMYLRKDGFRPLLARTGERALELVGQHDPVLAVIDVGLPDIDGFEVCRRIRERCDVPVLFLTARDDEVDRITGFEVGADDYVVKPFSPNEVVARVRAILRRARPERPSAAVRLTGAIVLDPARREVTVEDEQVALATQEFELLAFLARNRGLVLSRQQVLDGAWGLAFVGDERTVDVHVRQLRRKLGPTFALTTVWGVGYRLD
ncbi:MAG: response regulator transcription factor [Ilumatobacteraceae bacterium]